MTFLFCAVLLFLQPDHHSGDLANHLSYHHQLLFFSTLAGERGCNKKENLHEGEPHRSRRFFWIYSTVKKLVTWVHSENAARARAPAEDEEQEEREHHVPPEDCDAMLFLASLVFKPLFVIVGFLYPSYESYKVRPRSRSCSSFPAPRSLAREPD